jgi:hypothetical protein
MKTCPGVGVAAAEWLVRQDPLLVGADNWPVEVAPNPDPQLSRPGHQIFLVVNGVHILENPAPAPPYRRWRSAKRTAADQPSPASRVDFESIHHRNSA